MRNYIWTVWCAVHIESVPFPGTYQDLHAIGQDEDDLNVDAERRRADVESQYPVAYSPFSLTRAESIPVYFFFDKFTFVNFIQQGLQEVMWGFAVAPTPPQVSLWKNVANPDESPRYTGWTDDAGEKHDPPPSDKGTGATKQLGNLTFLSILEIVLNRLEAHGRLYVDELSGIIAEIVLGKPWDSDLLTKIIDYANTLK